MSFRSVGPYGMAAVTYRSKLRGANLLIFTRGGVRVSSMGSIEPTDFWSLYVVNPWIFWQNISGIEYDCHYLDSSLVLNPWIEIPNAASV